MLDEKFKIKIKRLSPDAIIPTKVTKGSAGYDAIIPRDYTLKFGRQVISLDIAISMPECLALDNRTRSGYAAKGLLCYDEEGKEYRIEADVILGLIDSDYRKGIGVIINVRDVAVLNTKLYLKRGQAVSQLKFCYVPCTEFVESDELDETERIGGFGKQNGE